MSYIITDEQIAELQTCLNQTLNNDITRKFSKILEAVKSQPEEESIGGWIAEDMKSACQQNGYTLSDDDAETLMERVERKADANYGISWDTIWYHAQQLDVEEAITLIDYEEEEDS